MKVDKIRFPDTSGFGIKPVSEEGSKRLVRAAIRYAIKEGRKSVTLVHKGNIMKYTEGAFKQWGYQVAKRNSATRFSPGTSTISSRKQGEDAANQAQRMAESEGRIIVKDAIADIFLQRY